jgi:formimidoylglutamate deiminase
MNRMIAEQALLPDGWHANVLFEWDSGGWLTQVVPDSMAAAGTPRAGGIAVPGMPNLHSHAFQRAMAGLTEHRADPVDSFWSWRTLMYAYARILTPPLQKAIATQLYIDMLKAGYTSVCEFHYLHHDIDGRPYANPAEQAECLIQAAQEAGIGLTLLPVLYQYGNFGAQAPHAGQARFISSPDWILDLLQRLRRAHPEHGGLRYGVAPHSLRAVSGAALEALLQGLQQIDPQAPVHIHIAEQTREVDDCLAVHRMRPVEWLLANIRVDARWCLVHATHMTADETRALAASGAVAGICPTTEANLGDGIFNGAEYAGAGGAWGIGSDSHVSISPCEELRLFEYSQRLRHRQRNILADEHGAVGGYLYRAALHGGALASGRPVAGLAVGQRADLLVLDAAHPDLCGRRGDRLLDSLIFCNHAPPPVRDVMCGGRWMVQNGRHALEDASGIAYAGALRELLAGRAYDKENP